MNTERTKSDPSKRRVEKRLYNKHGVIHLIAHTKIV